MTRRRAGARASPMQEQPWLRALERCYGWMMKSSQL
jgi:hypothetical protein